MASPFNWRGNYDLDTRYSPGDVVYFVDDGFTYICTLETVGIPPYIANSGFELFAGFEILDGGAF